MSRGEIVGLGWPGWLGLVVTHVPQVLLFTGRPFVGTRVAPSVWRGYVRFANALSLGLKRGLHGDVLREG